MVDRNVSKRELLPLPLVMKAVRTAAFYTLGCKLNFAETATISRQLKDHGFSIVDFDNGADVVVVNTCSVTDNADKKCRNIIRKAMRLNPNAFVAVVGCYAQLKPDEIAGIEGVDLVLGAGEKFNLLEHLGDGHKREIGEYHACEIQTVEHFVDGFSLGERTRSFLKVQDGCDYQCAFCTIPLARGRSRSDTIENVIGNARALGESGVREVVLTGVNTGDFGKGLTGGRKKEVTFFDLIQELDQVEEVERFRISSIEPNLLTHEIIEFVAQSNRFMPHFHIPLQSGSDEILNRMRRRYLSDLYVSRVEKIKSVMPHACIGVDVIVGFPGETDAHFEETRLFLANLDVSYLHVFTYSERPNTLATEMANPVPMEVRQKRSKILRQLSARKKRHFYRQFAGSLHEALMEEADQGGWMNGFTDNYIKVRLPYNESFVNSIIPVVIENQVRNGEVEATPLAEPTLTN